MQEKAQKKLEVIVDCAIPKKPRDTTSMAAEDPDETNTDEHGQREIPRTTNTRETETMCACICESYESMGKRTKESSKNKEFVKITLLEGGPIL